MLSLQPYHQRLVEAWNHWTYHWICQHSALGDLCRFHSEPEVKMGQYYSLVRKRLITSALNWRMDRFCLQWTWEMVNVWLFVNIFSFYINCKLAMNLQNTNFVTNFYESIFAPRPTTIWLFPQFLIWVSYSYVRNFENIDTCFDICFRFIRTHLYLSLSICHVEIIS